jgi:branched-chain amino acid transport system ATP-binding protein
VSEVSLLEVEDLQAGYGLIQVLHGVSLHVEDGEAVVILGANGSGKTTTLRALSGMIKSRGAIRFDGASIANRRPDRICAAGVAHVPQGRGTIVDLSVEDNLRIGAYSRKDSDVERDITDWYEVFPRLGERRDQMAGSMSGGEQQMLAIARALMSRPRLLLLDEPSLGLAPLVTREVFTQVARLVSERGTAVLLVEQNANLALEFASRAYVLEAGLLVAEGSAEQLKNDDAVRRAYLGA